MSGQGIRTFDPRQLPRMQITMLTTKVTNGEEIFHFKTISIFFFFFNARHREKQKSGTVDEQGPRGCRVAHPVCPSS